MEESPQLREDVKGEIWSALLREFRRQNGLSRKQAAERSGLSWRTWEGWELGRSAPTGLYKERLEQVLSKHDKKILEDFDNGLITRKNER